MWTKWRFPDEVQQFTAHVEEANQVDDDGTGTGGSKGIGTEEEGVRDSSCVTDEEFELLKKEVEQLRALVDRRHVVAAEKPMAATRVNENRANERHAHGSSIGRSNDKDTSRGDEVAESPTHRPSSHPNKSPPRTAQQRLDGRVASGPAVK